MKARTIPLVALLVLSTAYTTNIVYGTRAAGAIVGIALILSCLVGIQRNIVIIKVLASPIVLIWVIFYVWSAIVIVLVHEELPDREIAYLFLLVTISAYLINMRAIEMYIRWVIFINLFIMLYVGLTRNTSVYGVEVFSIEPSYRIIGSYLVSSGGIFHTAAPFALLVVQYLVLFSPKKLMLFVGTLSIFLSASRAALLASLVLLPRLKVSTTVLIVLAVSAGGLFYLDGLKDLLRLQSSGGIGSGRLQIWDTYIELVRASPLFGHGSDYSEFAEVINRDKGYRQSLSNKAHNVILTIAAKYGLVSLFLYFLAVFVPIIYWVTRRCDKRWFSVFLCTVIFSLFNDTLPGGLRLPTLFFTLSLFCMGSKHGDAHNRSYVFLAKPRVATHNL